MTGALHRLNLYPYGLAMAGASLLAGAPAPAMAGPPPYRIEAPAAAQDRDEPEGTAARELGPTLWGPLRAGMTRRQVSAAWRGHRVLVSPDCSASLLYGFDHRRLVSVTLEGMAGYYGWLLCKSNVEKSLAQKYGLPDHYLHQALEDENWPRAGSPLLTAFKAINPDKYDFEAWRLADVSILFRTKVHKSGWAVTYMPNGAPSAVVEGRL